MISRLTRVQLFLAGGVLFAGAYYAYELAAPPPRFESPTIVSSPIAEAKTPAPAGFIAPDAQAFAVIDERPIFSPLRKSPKIEAQGAAQAAAPPPANVTLMGIVIGPDDRFATLKTPASLAVLIARPGQEVGGWKLVEVEADHILLRAGANDQEIRLRSSPASMPAGNPAGPAGLFPPGMMPGVPPPAAQR
ncbi:hypothetical protein [Parvibaculum sp.]|uniref:hypothetical protein n=1 Tax=Parvibaculum sp. TaxID=2024848 RepID=UPI002BA3CA44|nr:hypothetical protein [Parvibaculum sp.]HUD52834.1 hypothetical protein [Parvibaculum sp.]